MVRSLRYVGPVLRVQSQITGRDCVLLDWLAEHGVLTSVQIAQALFPLFATASSASRPRPASTLPTRAVSDLAPLIDAVASRFTVPVAKAHRGLAR